MRSGWRWVGCLATVVCALAVGVACGAGEAMPPTPDSGSGSGSGADAAVPGGPTDAGTPDAGAADAGPPDAGPTDGGAAQLKTISFPNTPDWDFYGPQNGGPQDVRDVAMDEGGNLWVAGGGEGLFLMRPDASGKLSGQFEKFGIADGLHPYGWLFGEAAKGMGVPDGTPADPHPSLAATPVISVAGGAAGTVFVGYQGKSGCEDAWHGDQWTPAAQWGDPSVYKSGDADRVTLSGSGISVVHYDIFSGPGMVAGEIKGREKLCTIYRIAWDKQTSSVWFGGNHGFAVGKADAPNAPTCDGQPGCPAIEHSHPAISGCSVNYDYGTGNCPTNKTLWLTDRYTGVGVDPTTHDVWMGGANRTTLFRATTLGGFYAAADQGAELPAAEGGMAYRWDLWPDQVPEYDPSHGGVVYVMPLLRRSDGVGLLLLARLDPHRLERKPDGRRDRESHHPIRQRARARPARFQLVGGDGLGRGRLAAEQLREQNCGLRQRDVWRPALRDPRRIRPGGRRRREDGRRVQRRLRIRRRSRRLQGELSHALARCARGGGDRGGARLRKRRRWVA